jgi:hypothetical protein
MSLPDQQLADLRELGETHKRRIRVLQDAIRAAQQELAVHEVLLGLTQDEALVAALGNLYADSSDQATFARNPVQYCAKHGISLPPEVTLHAVQEHGPSTLMSANVRVGDWEIEVVWSRETGFHARPLKGYRRDHVRRVRSLIYG